MVDPLSAGASAVTIVDRLTALVRWVLRRPPPAPPGRRAPGRPVHAGLEVRPVHFTIDLTRPVPMVEVELLAINYLKHPLSLREVKITRLTAGSVAAAIDTIPLVVEPTIEPLSSFLVYCERALADTEARVAAASRPDSVYSGSLSITARGVVRGKEVTYTASALRIDGRLNRLRSPT